MKLIKTKILFDGSSEKNDYFIGFDGSTIRYSGKNKPIGSHEIIYECEAVTPAFIDAHSHIGMIRSGEPADEEEANERMNPIYPLNSALHSIYMDDNSFKESVESGVLYSVILPGSGNIISGNAVLVKNFTSNIKEAYIKDIGIKTALGYNPRSTEKWSGTRPSTRMGAIALLRENFLKAKKTTNLLRKKKKSIEEVDPITEIFMDILDKKRSLMVHLHKEDDVMILLQLAKEFQIKVIANHLCDVHDTNIFTELRSASIPIIYGPLDAFPYKVELKHESWRNIEKLIESNAKFSLMSDHPVTLQRNLFLGLRHLLRYGLSKSAAISKITKEAANILNIKNIGQIRPGYKASMIMWNREPFSLTSYPKLVLAEGKTVYED
ncbi:MAG: amidohydrolase family protein [Nitrososphaeraceae archaeon]